MDIILLIYGYNLQFFYITLYYYIIEVVKGEPFILVRFFQLLQFPMPRTLDLILFLCRL